MQKDDTLLQLLQAENWGVINQTDPLLQVDKTVLQQLSKAYTTHSTAPSTASSIVKSAQVNPRFPSSISPLNTASANRPFQDAVPGHEGYQPDMSGMDTLSWLQTHNLRSVDMCEASDLSEAQFISQYMVANRPVLIKRGMQQWRAVRSWVQPDGTPNIHAVVEAAGRDAVVSVTDTSQQQAGCGPCRETTLGHFADWWSSRRQHVVGATDGDDPQQQQQLNDPTSSTGLPGLDPKGHWYLKDWHFVTACPGYDAYELPTYFSSDWLNEHYDWLGTRRSDRINATSVSVGHNIQQANGNPSQFNGGSQSMGYGCEDQINAAMVTPRQHTDDSQTHQHRLRCSDYRFVYVGPAGSWTPLHSDVLRSFSWSANVAGRKLWLLLPPEYTHLAYDVNMSQAAPEFGHPCMSHLPPGCTAPIQQPLADNPQLASQFPCLGAARQHLHGVIQEAGEMLFVPSGWHHTVLNFTDTISINHNWLNAHNIAWCWQLVSTTHHRAAHSIQDCRSLCATQLEWWQLVQRMLEADCGLSLQGLARLCAGVIGRRLPKMLHGLTDRTEQLQMLLDVKRACSILDKIAELISREYDLHPAVETLSGAATAAEHPVLPDFNGFDFEQAAFKIGEVDSPTECVMLTKDMVARCTAALTQLPCVGCNAISD